MMITAILWMLVSVIWSLWGGVQRGVGMVPGGSGSPSGTHWWCAAYAIQQRRFRGVFSLPWSMLVDPLPC